MFPIGIVITLAVVIAHKSPSNLFENHPCLYLLSFGILSAKVINRLIVSTASSFYSTMSSKNISEMYIGPLSEHILLPALLFLISELIR